MKKGFTLIELIITIGLIALVGTVIVSNLSSTYTKQQEQQYENFKNTLENAACTYINLNVGASIKNTCRSTGSCNVTAKMLLEEGLVTEEDLKNPKTQTAIPNTTNIQITYQDGTTTCTYPD